MILMDKVAINLMEYNTNSLWLQMDNFNLLKLK